MYRCSIILWYHRDRYSEYLHMELIYAQKSANHILRHMHTLVFFGIIPAILYFIYFFFKAHKRNVQKISVGMSYWRDV